MQFCTTCRRPRIEGSKTCSGCGTPFPSGLANLPNAVGFRIRAPAGARSILALRPAAFIAIAIVLVASGTGAAVWLIGRHGSSPAAGAPVGAPFRPSSPTPAAPSAATTGPASPASSPTPGASTGTSVVAVKASAAQDPSASSVAAFLGRYFTAINSHHYHAYLALLSPQLQQGMTRGAFNSGYLGTVDSAERLLRISAAVDGDIQAAVAFTSHQSPTAANNQQTCTKWRISLFLGQGGSGYQIDPAPPGYHAFSVPC